MSEPVQNPLDQPQSDAALAFAAERRETIRKISKK